MNYRLIIVSCVVLHYQISALEIEKGSYVGCYKISQHSHSGNIRYINNCLDYCESRFYRCVLTKKISKVHFCVNELPVN